MSHRQKQLCLVSRMNIFVLLMTLFMLNGHCSAAYASSSLIPVQSDHPNTASDSLGMASNLDHHTNDASDCLDMHSDDPQSSPAVSSYKQLKDQQDGAKPLLASMSVLPEPRAGPCSHDFELYSADFVTTPLFYSLCVLRL